MKMGKEGNGQLTLIVHYKVKISLFLLLWFICKPVINKKKDRVLKKNWT